MNKYTQDLIKETYEWMRWAGANPHDGFDTHSDFLVRWGLEAFPVVTISPEMAAGFARTDPPELANIMATHAGLAIEIGNDNTFIMRANMNDQARAAYFLRGVPDHVLDRLDSSGGVAGFGKAGWADEEVERVIANVMYVLREHRACSEFEGVEVTERVPSVKANRKRGRKYFPGIEYVISPSQPLERERPLPSEETRTGWEMSVRTRVNGFWRRQAHGPRHSLRKIIWVKAFMRGPHDAPLSIHATVL